MDKVMLSEVLEKICIEDAAAITAAPMPKLSYGHRRQMKRIFSKYQKSLHTGRKYRTAGVRRLVFIVMIIFLAMFTVMAGAAAINGFNRKKYRDYTELLTVNAENCPKTIENVYYLSEIPEGYELRDVDRGDKSIYTAYVEPDTNRSIVLGQDVKDGYKCNFNTEYQEFEALNINGNYALYLDFSSSEEMQGLIVWDNGDYVLRVSGSFPKEELVLLAKSTKF